MYPSPSQTGQSSPRAGSQPEKSPSPRDMPGQTYFIFSDILLLLLLLLGLLSKDLKLLHEVLDFWSRDSRSSYSSESPLDLLFSSLLLSLQSNPLKNLSLLSSLLLSLRAFSRKRSSSSESLSQSSSFSSPHFLACSSILLFISGLLSSLDLLCHSG